MTAPAQPGAVVEAGQGRRPAQEFEESGRRAWRTELTGVAFTLPFLIMYALFLIWPVFLGLQMSFFDRSLTGSGDDDFLGLANYREALEDSFFWESLWHTLYFTILSVPPLVILSLVLALLANRAIPAQWLFRLSFFAPFLLPATVVTMVWGWIFQPDFGILNQYLVDDLGLGRIGWLTDQNVAMISIAIVTVWWTIGFNFLLYLAGLQDIPADLYEAASLDGASSWRQGWDITLPLLRRTTVLIIVLQILASLKVFDQIYLLTAGGPNFSTRPVIQYAYDEGFTQYRVGYASAMSYIFFVLVVAISIAGYWLQRRAGRES